MNAFLTQPTRILAKKLIALFCLLTLVSACNSVGPALVNEGSLVSVNFNGTDYVGKLSADGITAFLGIPFAKPPVAELRWRSPASLVNSTNSVNHVIADKFAPACMQGEHIANWYKDLIESFGGESSQFPEPEYSEDCLYLNIWAPKQSSVKKRPVFVFIHGGSNKGGWSYEPNYRGSQLAAQGIVVVSIAYRLGGFGYFSHPDLAQANYGLLDQIEALTWIKKNIAKVSGDPNNVTVAGESSGAHNIIHMLGSPLAKNLFQRAILQSGGWAMYGTPTKQSQEHLALALASDLLKNSDHHLNGSAAKKTDIDELRKESAQDLMKAIARVYQAQSFGPVIDLNSVTKTMQEAVVSDTLASVDLLIGSNKNEALMYVDESNTVMRWLQENKPAKAIDDVRAHLSDDGSKVNHLDELGTALDFTCPSLMLAEAMAATGGKTWVYQFAKLRDGDRGAEMGAYHGSELPYVFDTHDEWLPTSQEDESLTQAIMTYWGNFIHTGNPNASTVVTWPEFKSQDSEVQLLDTEIRSRNHPSTALCSALAN